MRNILTGLGRRDEQDLRAVAEARPEGGGATVLGYGVAPCTGSAQGRRSQYRGDG